MNVIIIVLLVLVQLQLNVRHVNRITISTIILVTKLVQLAHFKAVIPNKYVKSVE